MTGDGGTDDWCFGDLPDDLLGMIYRRFSSFYHQARFAAVCPSWRAAASWQPKLPALPLLLPSTGNGRLDRNALAYNPEEGRVLRAPLPWFPYGKRIVGSYDGAWVAAAIGCRTNVDITCRCPGPIARQSTGKISIEKVVFSGDPATEGCILAAMTTRCAIALFRLGVLGGEWRTRGCDIFESFIDIAFCNDELYGLSCGEELYKVVICRNKDGASVRVLLMKLGVPSPNNFDPKYIFELGGKLAMAVKVRVYKAQIFMVFELTINDTTKPYKYTWTEVTSLGAHALFLGPGCCKAVQVLAAGSRGKVEGNRIYYSKRKRQLPDNVYQECLDKLNLGSCYVYSYENKEAHHLERVTSRGYYYLEKLNGINGRNSCTWILPPHF